MKINLQFATILMTLFACGAQAQNAAEQFAPENNGTITKINYQLPLTPEVSEITIEKVNGYAIYEGDIVLYELGTPDDPESGIQRDAGIVNKFGGKDQLWTGGVIPYEIEKNHPKKDLIEEAIAAINEGTVLTIRAKTKDDTDYVFVRNEDEGCWSKIGRIGKKQYMGVSKNCSKGNIMHEFLHTAGMYHEQSRMDRDEFVTIETDNINPKKIHNFDKKAKTTSICDFDFGSMMLYPSRSFSKTPGLTTITANKTLPDGVRMGQRTALSECDAKGVLNLYKTRSTKSDALKPYWFGDVFLYENYRVQGNIYNTGKDYNWKSSQKPNDPNLSTDMKQYFDIQKRMLDGIVVKNFTFVNCEVAIELDSNQPLEFDIRFGKADNYNQWYSGQFGGTTKSSRSGYTFKFEASPTDCIQADSQAYFVVLVAKYYDSSNGYIKAEAPVAVRYYTPEK